MFEYTNLEASELYVERYMRMHGPYDALVGFSQARGDEDFLTVCKPRVHYARHV